MDDFQSFPQVRSPCWWTGPVLPPSRPADPWSALNWTGLALNESWAPAPTFWRGTSSSTTALSPYPYKFMHARTHTHSIYNAEWTHPLITICSSSCAHFTLFVITNIYLAFECSHTEIQTVCFAWFELNLGFQKRSFASFCNAAN